MLLKYSKSEVILKNGGMSYLQYSPGAEITSFTEKTNVVPMGTNCVTLLADIFLYRN